VGAGGFFRGFVCDQVTSLSVYNDRIFIGLPSAARYFRGKAKVAVTFTELEAAVSAGEKVAGLYFLFEWGCTLTAEQVRFSNGTKSPSCPPQIPLTIEALAKFGFAARSVTARSSSRLGK